MQKSFYTSFVIFLVCNYSYAQANVFSAKAIKEDLLYLKEALFQKHPNLLTYSTWKEVDSFFIKIEKEIPENITEYQAYEIITSVSSVLKDGHTLFFPSAASTKYHNTNSVFFPFQVYWNGERLFVYKNLSHHKQVSDGDEIIAINGTSASFLFKRMLQYMMRDGDNFNYPIWVLNNFFLEYYSYYYGHPKEFELLVIDNLRMEQEYLVAGLSKTDIRENKKKRYLSENHTQAIYFDVNEEKTIKTLVIKDWHNANLKKVYRQNFKKEIQHFFAATSSLNIENLIIDLRNNQGGDIKNAVFLLSYLLDKPFKVVESYRRVDQRERYSEQYRLKGSRGPSIGWHQVQDLPYQGKIYVLINGGSFSNSAIFCSILKEHNRAIFIGEETGGSEYILSSDIQYIQLPTTKIQVQLPRLQFYLKNFKARTTDGVLPDYLLKPNVQEMIKNKDAIYEFTLELIKKEN